MKNILLLLLLAIGISTSAQITEQGPPKCFADQLLNSAINSNPEIRHRIDNFNNKARNRIMPKNGNTPTLTIPILIYVVHENAAHIVTDAQIQNQIQALNDYFEDAGITFCLGTKRGMNPLAVRPGQTQTSPGIIHYTNFNLSNIEMTTDLDALSLSVPAGTSGNLPDNFLRIWIVKNITNEGQEGTLGFASFPGMTTFFDGIVIKSNVFGNINTCPTCDLLPNYDQGKTLVHEVGHYLGLYHTFEGGCQGLDSSSCATKGDMVCDTPPVSEPNFSCTAGIDSCSEMPNFPDNINNFMDYGSDNCVNIFTEGQRQRMFDMLYSARADLISTENLIFTGVCGSENILTAEFSANNYTPCTGNPITFTPLATGPGMTYQWNFGDPASGANNTSSLINPSHIYNSSGDSPYTVTLIVINADGSNQVIMTKDIYVTTCTPIISTEGNWYFSLYNGLNFGSGVPVYDNSAFINNNNMIEACAVQNNTSGSLLFYTNGTSVWNNQHTEINTTPLLGNRSSHAGALIVPNPGNTNQYYIFTKDAEELANGFRFSIVNINGTTATMSTTINTPITIPLGYQTGNNGAIIGNEGVTAIAACDGYWILTANKKNNQFYLCTYKLTSTGLTFISELLLPITAQFAQSKIEVSPNGNKIVFIADNGGASGELSEIPGVFLYDFNKYTGIVSNQIDLGQGTYAYGGSFSPDSKLLYVSSRYRAYQYNITDVDPANSRAEIFGFDGQGDLQLGPDNKIYIASHPTLAVIHKPNEIITVGSNNCHYTSNGPILEPSTSNLIAGLPNMIDAKQTTVFNNTISSYAQSCMLYKFAPNVCGTSFSWNFGDPASGASNTSTLSNPTHTFSAPGTYTITLVSGSTNLSIQITVGGTAPIITGNDTACLENENRTNHSVTLSPGQTVTWSATGGTLLGLNGNSSVMVNWTSLPGTIQATTTDATGCVHVVQHTVTSYCAGDECPENITFTTPETATNEVYNVSNNIIAHNNYQVQSGSNIELVAANDVLLKPTACVKSGSVFVARIASCTPGRMSLGTEDLITKQLIAHPNPTTGLLQLTGKTINAINIFDLLGKEVYSASFNNTDEITINISSLLEGLYLVKVTTDTGEIETLKIIKE